MPKQLKTVGKLSILGLGVVIATAFSADARSGRGFIIPHGGSGFHQGGGYSGGWRGYGGARNYGFNNGWRGRGYGYGNGNGRYYGYNRGWRGRGYGYGGYYGGWGYGVGGLALGGLLGAAIMAPGYGYGGYYQYPPYYGPELQEAPPYNGHRCFWSSDRTYTDQGQILAKPVQICD